MAPSIQRYEAEAVDPSPLGQPLKFEFSGRTAPNRFMKGAMTERLSSWDVRSPAARGVPLKQLINVYKRWGEGTIGTILTGNIMIAPDHLEASGNAIIPPDAPFDGERFEAFKHLAAESKKHGSLIVGQVSHPGRQVAEMIQPNPISASDVQLTKELFGMTFAKPRPATKEDIDALVESWVHAAEFLEKAGYDGIQLHGAHGYLLSQFLSQTTNKRTDNYGGSLENRARIIIEIAKGVRQRTSASFILGIKLNSVEFQDDGFTPAEAKQICAILEANEFDFVELSGGTYESLAFVHTRDSTRRREAFFLEFAEEIVPTLKKTKVFVTGGFKTVAGMVTALDSVDGVGLARAFCAEPRFAADVLAGKTKATFKPTFDDSDFFMSNIVAGTQIKQVGNDHDPIDLSQKENEEKFGTILGNFMKEMADNADGSKYGFPEVTGVPQVPYGTALA